MEPTWNGLDPGLSDDDDDDNDPPPPEEPRDVGRKGRKPASVPQLLKAANRSTLGESTPRSRGRDGNNTARTTARGDGTSRSSKGNGTNRSRRATSANGRLGGGPGGRLLGGGARPNGGQRGARKSQAPMDLLAKPSASKLALASMTELYMSVPETNAGLPDFDEYERLQEALLGRRSPASSAGQQSHRTSKRVGSKSPGGGMSTSGGDTNRSVSRRGGGRDESTTTASKKAGHRRVGSRENYASTLIAARRAVSSTDAVDAAVEAALLAPPAPAQALTTSARTIASEILTPVSKANDLSKEAGLAGGGFSPSMELSAMEMHAQALSSMDVQASSARDGGGGQDAQRDPMLDAPEPLSSTRQRAAGASTLSGNEPPLMRESHLMRGGARPGGGHADGPLRELELLRARSKANVAGRRDESASAARQRREEMAANVVKRTQTLAATMVKNGYVPSAMSAQAGRARAMPATRNLGAGVNDKKFLPPQPVGPLPTDWSVTGAIPRLVPFFYITKSTMKIQESNRNTWGDADVASTNPQAVGCRRNAPHRSSKASSALGERVEERMRRIVAISSGEDTRGDGRSVTRVPAQNAAEVSHVDEPAAERGAVAEAFGVVHGVPVATGDEEREAVREEEGIKSCLVKEVHRGAHRAAVTKVAALPQDDLRARERRLCAAQDRHLRALCVNLEDVEAAGGREEMVLRH